MTLSGTSHGPILQPFIKYDSILLNLSVWQPGHICYDFGYDIFLRIQIEYNSLMN